MNWLTWDPARNQPKELALKRHQDGMNVVYVDGHAKWGRWSQLWWQKTEPLIREGNFDPRQ
jgi:prepilin-type processing-associated H-X9-DG protein